MADETKRLLFLGREAFWTHLRGKERPYDHVNITTPTPEQREAARLRHAEIMAELAQVEIPEELRDRRLHPYVMFPDPPDNRNATTDKRKRR